MSEPLEMEEGFVDISEGKDGGLLKKTITEGTGEEMPPPGSAVKVHYVGTLHDDGSKFDSSRDRPGTFDFDVGVGQVIKGWDEGICSMKKGEKCVLRCRSDYAYGDGGSPPKIPGKATLNFEVELFDWKEKVKEAGSMTPEERMEHALKCKEAGTEAFKAGDWATAVNRYEDGAQYITYDPTQGWGDDDDDDDDDDGASPAGLGDAEKKLADDCASPAGLGDAEKKLAVALLNNCAAAKLKLGDEEGAKEDCSKVLGYDASNSKALFRSGQAELALGNFAACVQLMERAKVIDPADKACEQLRRKALEEEKKVKRAEKAMAAKMFG